MKKAKISICLVLVAVFIVSAISSMATGFLTANDISPEDLVSSELEEYSAEVYPEDFASATSFFEDVYPSVNESEGEYINPYFAAYRKTQNTSNFQSLATASYANINGRTVTVDTFYRQYCEALNDPNFGLGMLLYQCIQYKMANPQADVKLCFSAFRVSAVAALCLDRNSPYFGYMRSLYSSDYDDNGFVRISYMFVEAAKMGIDVTIVGHLNSYAVKQYSNSSGKTYYPAEPSYIKYFQKSLNYECYDKYAAGDTVSDHMRFEYIRWDRQNKQFTDVMHVKTLAVSHYLDYNGVEHEYGVWLSSTNLDSLDYKGYNGNNGTQSGVIITGHKEIYRIVNNYMELMYTHCDQDQVFDLRHEVISRNTKQIDMILAGNEEMIPEDEQIVYLGSESDNVFEMYFTPLGGDIDTWDTQRNPYCKFIQEFYESEDYVVFSWNNPNFQSNTYIAKTIESVLHNKFVENKNLSNRLGIRCQNGIFESLKNLKAGEDLAFYNLKTTWDAVHNKDIFMSYEKNGERQYISLISSCNFNEGALFYQTNSVLMIKETDATGNVVYSSMGDAASKGTIKYVDEGQTFSSDERISMTEKLDSFPTTFSAIIELSKKSGNSESYGNIFSNNDYWNKHISYEIDKNGHPKVIIGWPELKDGTERYKNTSYTFYKVNACTGKRLSLTIVANRENDTLSCYVDGVLQQTITDVAELDIDCTEANTFVVGGDNLGSNYNYFKGTIYGIGVWSDIRTDKEIAMDADGKYDVSNPDLMASYDLTVAGNTRFADRSSKENDLRSIKLWLDEDDVVPVDENAYCFAVVGDTQALSWFDKDGMADIYDWLVANKDSKNIEYVIGLGDITEMSYQREWDYAKEQIYKLDGVVPYSVVMGNHDKYEFMDSAYEPENRQDYLFNQSFYDDRYLDELDGWYGDGDVSCSYNAFEIGQTKWLLLNLDFGPTDAMLEWAADVIEQYPEHKVVIVTHAYLYRDGSTLDDEECYPSSEHNSSYNDGDDIWDKLVSKYENIELVLCGHDPWDHIVCTQSQGDHGNTVTQMLINPQYMDKYYGSTEMIALLYFSEDGNTMTVRYYSIAKEMYGSEISQFTVNLG